MPRLTTRQKRQFVRDCPDFAYLSRPGDGTAHYVFRSGWTVKIGLAAAYAYALNFQEAATP